MLLKGERIHIKPAKAQTRLDKYQNNQQNQHNQQSNNAEYSSNNNNNRSSNYRSSSSVNKNWDNESHDQSEGSNDRSKFDYGRTVYIGNLSGNAKEEDLRYFFSDVGKITRVSVARRPNNNKTSHFGFVEFESSFQARQSLAKHGMLTLLTLWP